MCLCGCMLEACWFRQGALCTSGVVWWMCVGEPDGQCYLDWIGEFDDTCELGFVLG